MKTKILFLMTFCLLTGLEGQAQSYTTLPYCQDFESGGLDIYWSANPDTLNNGIVGVVNGAGASSIYGIRMGKSTDSGGFAENSVDLHLDLTGLNNEELVFNFEILDYGDETHAEDGVYFSDNGGNSFQKISEIDFVPQNWITAWRPIRPFGFDFDDLMDKYGLTYSSTFVIRFQQYDNADFNDIGDEDGVRLDNICVDFEKPLVYESIPYKQNFDANSDLDFYYEWHIGSDSVVDKTANFETISRFAEVRIVNSIGTDGSYALRMGKNSDSEGYNINAIDLHLNIAGLDNEELVFNFDILDYLDETHVEDGVYFSDDGGYTFQKISEIDFVPQNWITAWRPIRPFGFDFDDLMDKYGLTYSSTFVIRFQQYDNADFNDIGDEDGIRLDNVCVDFEKPLVYESIPYKQNFDANSDLDFYYEWHIGSDSVVDKTANFEAISRFAEVRIVNSIGTDGSYALRMGKSSDSEGYNINAIDLHLNIAGLDNEELVFNFDIHDYADETHVEDGVYFSDDGGYSFQKITEIDFVPADWVNSAWASIRPFGFDFDDLMDKYSLNYSSTFVIRFQQYDNADFNTTGDEDGIVLDNICLDFEKPLVYESIPYKQDFDSNSDLSNYYEWHVGSDSVLNKTASFEAISRFALVNVAIGAGFGGSYGLQMGKRSDSEGDNINATDLHLDLTGLDNEQLLFNFDIYDFADETHVEDGVHFSDDGGYTFQRITEIDFVPGSWANSWGSMQAYGYDFDELMDQYGLNYSSTFVIRFQQYDNADFNTTGDEDGIRLDNICLDFDKTVTYQTLPFCDNFAESCIGTNDCPFGEAWYVSSFDAVNGSSPTCSDAQSLTRYARLEIWGGASSNGDGYSVRMGKHSDSDGFNTNALDLHLDLSGHQNNQVLLSFYLDLFGEESHLEDAIFLSADDGITWVKALTINGTNLPSSGFNYIELDLSNEINSNTSLSFSSTFIVRFQQYDNADFNTTGDEDGFIIDDVQVYANGQTCEIVNACLPSLILTDSLNTGLYHADIDVQSDGLVPSGNVVDFKAGQIIMLDSGFTIEQGADFSGEIEDCGDGN